MKPQPPTFLLPVFLLVTLLMFSADVLHASQSEGGIYQVKTKAMAIGDRTRSVKIKEKGGSKQNDVSEFSEESINLKTMR